MLLVPLTARAQNPAGDLRGIYIYTNDVSQITKATSTALAASFNVPGVDGVAVVIGWDAIEPALGQYQWTLLDQWIVQASSLGKKIDLVDSRRLCTVIIVVRCAVKRSKRIVCEE